MKSIFRALLFVIFFGAAGDLAAAPTAVELGFIATLSGPRASLGRDALDGANLALSEVNAQSPVPIKLQVEDSQGDPKTGISAYKKLLRDGRHFILTQNSNVSLPISQLVNNDQVLQLARCTTADAYSSAHDLTFRVNGSTYNEAQKIAQAVKEKYAAGPAAVGIVTMEDEYPEMLRKNLAGLLKNQNIPVAFSDSFAPKENDFRSVISKLKQRKISILAFLSYPTEAGTFARQFSEQQPGAITIVFNTAVNAPEYFAAAGEAADGKYLAALAVELNSPAARAFQRRYNRAPSWMAASGYDAVKIANQALGQCAFKIDLSCLSKALYGIKHYDGLSGTKGFDDVFGDMSDVYKLVLSKGGKFVDTD